MRNTLVCAAMALALSQGSALAQSGEITIWSWNIAASSLKETVAGFNKQHPDIKVNVQDLGNQQVFDKTLAGCAAGGAGLPDIITVENQEAEIFWNQFPDCFADLKTLGYTDATAKLFPEFKRVELEANGKVYAMPWDSGPVTVFYRRDFYEKAGVDPASIRTWDDFIAAGKKITLANPGVIMTEADLNGDDEFFRMISNEQGCGYFSPDGSTITVNQPGCVTALETVRKMKADNLVSAANWDEKIQATKAGKVATHIFGGWYEGTIRSNAKELAGKWGVYPLPSATVDGPHAANLGGSSLAITEASKNKEAAYAFTSYALGTVEGQVTMLKAYGLVPSLLSALDDPFVQSGQPYWGDQKIWVDVLSTLPKVKPSRGTTYFTDANKILTATQLKYIEGGYPDAKAALDDAARQIELATGLPLSQ
ncbi:ABC transporter substrate-binding protein [Mesorhizobium sp. NPDC059025]|uniref:ABC transporter substrate-binding protein n=1 Tax=unclassified Mesorhizobium TaxID=325217 RepID=UPI00368269E2